MVLKEKNSPFLTYTILPVCSEITMTSASVFSVIPNAALWRRPYFEGILFSSDTGRITRVAIMVFLSITIAPSWRGLFLKKIVSKI
jgi:hypothetical protein